jgi:hypothetical protein
MHSKQVLDTVDQAIRRAALRYPPGDVRSAIEQLTADVAEELSGGDEVVLAMGRLIPASEAAEYYEDGEHHVYFDANDAKVTSTPSRVLVSLGEPYLSLLDAQLGGSWWHLQPGSDLWVSAASDQDSANL